MKAYVIQSVRLGFWADSYKEFKGWLYATKYSNLLEANQAIPIASKIEPCHIIEVYY